MKISADKRTLETLGEWGKSYSYSRAIESDSGEYKHLHYGDIHGKLAGKVSSCKLPILTVEGKHEIVSTGDVIFADASEDYDALGKASVLFVEEGDKVLSGLHTHRLIVNKALLDSGYLLSFTQSPAYKRFIRVIGNGVSVLGISKTNLGKLELPLPSLAEQQKIAEFFSALDERIALTADKVKLLKEQKTGYLQKVFNRELVFTDDNGDTYGDWEQKKLGDVATNSPKKYDPLKSNEEYRSVELENINGGGSGRINGWFNSLDQKSTKNVFRAGDVLLGKLRPYLKKWARPDFDGVCSTEIWVLTGKDAVTNEFLYVLVQSPAVQQTLIDITSGTKMPRADWKAVATTKIPLPSLPEQEKIAEFFSALDRQLELTENKLALLKEQKKGYLQGIFG